LACSCSSCPAGDRATPPRLAAGRGGGGGAEQTLRAVSVVFTLLPIVEVAGLIFALARSVADSLGKQFELLALILIRLALSAPPFVNVPLAGGASLFALATSLAYDAWSVDAV
jgi:hypothetical protein